MKRKIALFYSESPLIIRLILLPILFLIVLIIKNKITIFKGEKLSISISNAIKKFGYVPSTSLNNDIIKNIVLFLITPEEYFLYNFKNISLKQRDAFLPDMVRLLLLKDVSGNSKFNLLYNKYNFYKRTEEYFKREAILFDNKTSFNVFSDFVEKHGRVFIKENCGSYGYNARLVDLKKDNINDIYNELLDSDIEYIMEVAISQHPMMAIWNESSVNTVRIPTFLTNNGFFVAEPFLRTGRAGAIVDNAGAGGIFAVIDPNDGKIITDGVDESGHTYIHHPNSNLLYKGWVIPEWDKLIKVCEECHKAMSDHVYIAYDFAYTDKGEWVLVEGNWGQFVSQIATKVGSKDLFKKLISN